MVEQMARTEAALAKNTAILDQVQQHLGLPPILLTPVAAATGSQALPHAAPAVIPAAAAVDSTPVPLVASIALPTTHPSALAQSQDEDKIPPSTTT